MNSQHTLKVKNVHVKRARCLGLALNRSYTQYQLLDSNELMMIDPAEEILYEICRHWFH